jgi:hypothetical protein
LAREGRFVPGRSNVKYMPLMDPQLALPSFHTKMGLMEIFVKALDKNNDGLNYLKQNFQN